MTGAERKGDLDRGVDKKERHLGQIQLLKPIFSLPWHLEAFVLVKQ